MDQTTLDHLIPFGPGEEYTQTDIHTADPGGSHVESGVYFLKACLCELPHFGAGEKCEGEEAAERSCYGPTVTSDSMLFCTSWERGKVQDLERKSEFVPWKKGKVEGKRF